MMKLFDGAVAWRANKQNTVTISFTEAELLVVLQMAKEAIYFSQLMKSLMFILLKALTIECDNQQTIRLLVKKAMKLQAKLRYVDIHSHLLKQKVQRQIIHIWWVPTKRMIANGLTKALTSANHKVFSEMIGLKDQGKCLASIKLEENQRDVLLLCGAE